jgi:hypothetical protein
VSISATTTSTIVQRMRLAWKSAGTSTRPTDQAASRKERSSRCGSGRSLSLPWPEHDRIEISSFRSRPACVGQFDCIDDERRQRGESPGLRELERTDSAREFAFESCASRLRPGGCAGDIAVTRKHPTEVRNGISSGNRRSRSDQGVGRGTRCPACLRQRDGRKGRHGHDSLGPPGVQRRRFPASDPLEAVVSTVRREQPCAPGAGEDESRSEEQLQQANQSRRRDPQERSEACEGHANESEPERRRGLPGRGQDREKEAHQSYERDAPVRNRCATRSENGGRYATSDCSSGDPRLGGSARRAAGLCQGNGWQKRSGHDKARFSRIHRCQIAAGDLLARMVPPVRREQPCAAGAGEDESRSEEQLQQAGAA